MSILYNFIDICNTIVTGSKFMIKFIDYLIYKAKSEPSTDLCYSSHARTVT